MVTKPEIEVEAITLNLASLASVYGKSPAKWVYTSHLKQNQGAKVRIY